MRSPGAPSHRREVERELLSTDQDARRTKRSRVGPPCSSLVVAVSSYRPARGREVRRGREDVHVALGLGHDHLRAALPDPGNRVRPAGWLACRDGLDGERLGSNPRPTSWALNRSMLSIAVIA